MMTVSGSARFSQLHNFHYGYLGEDWAEDYGDVERAVADYLAEEEPDTLAATVHESEELLAAPDFPAICMQLTQYFRPNSWTEADMRSWIVELRDRAQAELRRRPE